MRFSWQWYPIVTLVAALASACGSSADSKPITGTGGSPGAGGTSGGGAGGTAGGGGTGGTDSGTSDPCMAAPNPGETAICVTLHPESITPENDPTLDERGVLAVQVFATATPPLDTSSASVALAQYVAPPQGSTTEFALADVTPVRLAGAFPATVYVRALFIDAPGATTIGAGFWLGGFDVTNGIQQVAPLLPVNLQVGQANALDMDLKALRRLTATVHLATTPVGDGQGPLQVFAVSGSDITKNPPVFGYASFPCVDLPGADAILQGFVIGPGPYWITAVLNDLLLPGVLPPGAAVSLDVTSTSVTIPTQLVLAPTDYTPSATVDLNYTIPASNPDGGALPPNSCAVLFPPPTDAGTGG